VTSLKRHTSATHLSLAPLYIFFTRAQGQNKQIPHQFKRGIYLFLERAWPREESLAEDSSTQKIQQHSHKFQEALPARQQFLSVPVAPQMALRAGRFCRKGTFTERRTICAIGCRIPTRFISRPARKSQHAAKSSSARRTYCQTINKPQDTEESLRFSDAEAARSPAWSSA